MERKTGSYASKGQLSKPVKVRLHSISNARTFPGILTCVIPLLRPDVQYHTNGKEIEMRGMQSISRKAMHRTKRLATEFDKQLYLNKMKPAFGGNYFEVSSLSGL